VLVQSQSAKKAILAALADKEMTKILDSIMYHSKSIVDITRENNIPHTTCYRKTKWLLNEGLVIVDKIIITPEGKKFSLYHSVLKSGSVEINNFSHKHQSFVIALIQYTLGVVFYYWECLRRQQGKRL
jgi:hypothetical protein